MTKSRKGQGVINISGQVFGRLTAIKQDTRESIKHHAKWICLCECGNELSVSGVSLRKGATKSCGCYRQEVTKSLMTKHGHAQRGNKSRGYMVWEAMISRCHTKTNKDYPQYGGRGIFVCDEWRESFDSFVSEMGNPESGMTIERIDVNSGYSKINCCWVSRKTQSRNTRRTTRIGNRPLIDICEELGLKHETIMARVRSGVPPEFALRMTKTEYSSHYANISNVSVGVKQAA